MTERANETEVKEEHDGHESEERRAALEADGVRDPISDHCTCQDPSAVASEEARSDGEPASLTEPEVLCERPRRTEFFHELAELRELFPEATLDDLPTEVKESELQLAAAYALYDCRRRRLREIAEAENKRNAERSAGGISDGDDGSYSPDEVRRMTRDEIRKNYDAVLRSMKRWG